jgi:hypothetical protein
MKIKAPSKMKINKVKKYHKVEVPSVKTAKAALSKAEKKLVGKSLPAAKPKKTTTKKKGK